MINKAGEDLLTDFEKFAKTLPGAPDVAHAYWDAIGGVWTIGRGFTRGVKQGDTMTRAEDAERFREEMTPIYDEIRKACNVVPNENEIAAMCSLAWNIGMGWRGSKKPKGAKDGFLQSTVLRAHNRGDRNAASRAFGLWNKSNGREVDGLTRRRAAEAALYLKPVGNAAPSPQHVDAESSLAKSPIINATSAGAVSATLAVVAESVKSVKGILGDLGEWVPYVAIAAVIVLAGYVIYTRIRQRKGGWA